MAVDPSDDFMYTIELSNQSSKVSQQWKIHPKMEFEEAEGREASLAPQSIAVDSSGIFILPIKIVMIFSNLIQTAYN